MLFNSARCAVTLMSIIRLVFDAPSFALGDLLEYDGHPLPISEQRNRDVQYVAKNYVLYSRGDTERLA